MWSLEGSANLSKVIVSIGAGISGDSTLSKVIVSTGAGISGDSTLSKVIVSTGAGISGDGGMEVMNADSGANYLGLYPGFLAYCLCDSGRVTFLFLIFLHHKMGIIIAQSCSEDSISSCAKCSEQCLPNRKHSTTQAMIIFIFSLRMTER